MPELRSSCRRGCPDLDQRHEQHHAALDRTIHAGQGDGAPGRRCTGGNDDRLSIVGWVANHFGPRWSLAVGAGACFTAALIAIYVLAHRKEPLPSN
jgi:hypothetical protein